MEGYHSSVALEYIVSLASSTLAEQGLVTHHEHAHKAIVHHGHHEDPYKVVKELSISVVCITLGAALFVMSEKCKTPGVFLVFFGAQTGMNIYMKAVFSSAVVADPIPAAYQDNCAVPGDCQAWVGFQASFFVTAMQQFLSFFIFWIVFGLLKSTGMTKYELKVLKDKQEWIAVLCFAVSFTLNIALNNWSLSLIPLTLNLIIRSCLPLTTFFSQWIMAKCTTGEGKPIRIVEIGLMALGVAMAGVVVFAKLAAKKEEAGQSGKQDESGTLMMGVIVCVVSLFSGSVNLALAGVLGTSVKLDSMGTVVYNSIPATLLLVPFVFLYSKPVRWDGFGSQPEWEVAKMVWSQSKSTFALAAGSSVLALVYNVLQFGIVQYMTATHVAFAGNFNKAATIPLALAVQMDHLPTDPTTGMWNKWAWIILAAACGNIFAFAMYNMATGGAGGHGHSKPADAKPLSEDEDDDDSEDDEDDTESEDGGCCHR